MANKKITVALILDDSKYRRNIDKVKKDTNSLTAGFGRLGPAIAGAFSVAALAKFGTEMIRATKTLQNVRNQLTLITDGTDDLNRVMALLTNTATNNRASFEATAELFTKLRIATDDLGKSEEDVVQVTTKLQQALAVAGADAATTNSVIRQFGQAMASGTVRGDEFNSIVEGLGPALAIMARESGITIGRLREMSRAGELTADVLFEMLQNSQSLSSAFENMQPTLEQLETALGDAFDRALAKLGEVTGATSAYENIIKGLTRTFDRIAGTEGAIGNMSLAEIMEGIEAGTIGTNRALEELEIRLKAVANYAAKKGIVTPAAEETAELINLMQELNVEGEGFFGGFTREQARAGVDHLTQIKEQIVGIANARKIENDEAQRQLELAAEQQRIYDNLVAPFKEYIELADKFVKNDYRTEQEKINDRVATATKVIEELRNAQSATMGGLEQYTERMAAAEAELAAATQAQTEFNEAVERNDGITTLNEYIAELTENARKQVEETNNQTNALAELDRLLQEGSLSTEVYSEAVAILNERIGEQLTLFESLTDELEEIDTIDEYNAMLEKLNEQFAQGNITLQEYIELLRQLREVYSESDEMFASFINMVEDLAKGLGDDLANAFVNGENLMESMKDTFKRAITQMIADAFRLRVVQPILQGIFGGSFGAGGAYTPSAGGLLGGIIGSIFGRANGGPVTAGGTYLIGEKGPEILKMGSQSGTVIPNHAIGGGTTNVTYNINALDTRSWKQMLAADPEYMFNLTQAGARRVPG